MDMDSILAIVGIIVLLGVAGGSLFGALKVRQAINAMDTKLDPKLDELKVKLDGLKPAVAEVGPLMESVNITLDSLDMTVVEVDGKLEQLKGITGTVVGVSETVPEVVGDTKDAVKARFSRKH